MTGATDGSMPVGSAEIIYVIFQNKYNLCSTTSTPSSQRMPLFDLTDSSSISVSLFIGATSAKLLMIN